MENPNQTTHINTDSLKASDEAVKFLLDYSKSYSVVKSRGLVFERNLN
ncbi:hypothetical protein [Robiginitalea sp.]